MWEPLVLDAEAAHAHGRVFGATRAAGRTSRTRFADLLIAATAAPTACRSIPRTPGTLSVSTESSSWSGFGASGLTRARDGVDYSYPMRSVLVNDEWDSRKTKMEVG